MAGTAPRSMPEGSEFVLRGMGIDAQVDIDDGLSHEAFHFVTGQGYEAGLTR